MNSNHVALSKICIAADQLILQSQHASPAAATSPGVDFQHRKKTPIGVLQGKRAL